MAAAVRTVIATPNLAEDHLTKRARSRLAELSADLEWTLAENPVRNDHGDWSWWTYAGSAQNRLLAAKIRAVGGRPKFHDGYHVAFDAQMETGDKAPWQAVRATPIDVIEWPILRIKFEELLPDHIRSLVAEARARC